VACVERCVELLRVSWSVARVVREVQAWSASCMHHHRVMIDDEGIDATMITGSTFNAFNNGP
jgi:hypothetical protein